MPEWSKGVDLRPTVNDAWVQTPLQPFSFYFYIIYKNKVYLYIKILFVCYFLFY